MELSPARYRAPALEKGLDILELFSNRASAITLRQLSDELGRSKGEIFRMVQVLEERGYITRRPGDDGYVLTNRLFTLGIKMPPMRGLLEIGLPMMHQLAETLHQSCHLTVASGTEIVVIARVESPGGTGFSVRLGHRAPLAQSNSGFVLFAWQPAPIREQWKVLCEEAGGTLDQNFDATLDNVRLQGRFVGASRAARGVTDVCLPVLQSNVAVAALSVPYVVLENATAKSLETVIELTTATARSLSEGILVGLETVATKEALRSASQSS